jgi:hypothetical protein
MPRAKKVKPTPPSQQPAESAACYTVDGKPIPAHLVHLIPYALTDQGKRENERRLEGRPKHSGIEFGRSQESLRDQAFLEGAAGDPQQAVIDQARQAGLLPAGMHPRFLSRRRAEDRDFRGHEVVLDENRQPYTYKGMVLGMVPEDLHQTRQAVKSARSNEPLRTAFEAAHEALQEAAAAAPQFARALPAGERVQGYGETAGAAEIGLTITRGE